MYVSCFFFKTISFLHWGLISSSYIKENVNKQYVPIGTVSRATHLKE